jgi:hypothetical protein
MEMNLFENYPNTKINFEEKWESYEWTNLETHTQINSKKKFVSFLLNNLQVWNSRNSNYFMSTSDDNLNINKNINYINNKIIFIR